MVQNYITNASTYFFFFVLYSGRLYIFFFFQAEDDIRYGHVTGVQTCALPISRRYENGPMKPSSKWSLWSQDSLLSIGSRGSEERRVGKECRFRWSPPHEK